MLNWLPATDDHTGGIRYNVYASREWPVDTELPENLVVVGLTDTQWHYNEHLAQTYGLHFAVTAMDRAGNESEALQLSEAPELPSPDGLLACDGRRLRLPRLVGQFVVITDLSGRAVLRAKPAAEVNVSRLANGYYHVYVLQRKGKRARKGHVGVFWNYRRR